MIAAPPPTGGIEVWVQAARATEVAGRPLGSTLHVFRSGRAVTIPTWHGDSLPSAAARMMAGAVVTAKARRVGSLYLAPTTKGWACMQGPTFLTCHRGLLPAGITWGFQSTATGIAINGIAADDVARVSLGSRTATVHDNVFFLTRAMKLSPLPKTFGTLVVRYRDGRPPARVVIR